MAGNSHMFYVTEYILAHKNELRVEGVVYLLYYLKACNDDALCTVVSIN